MSAEPAPSYVFGPLERRGLIAGLRGGQIALIGLGVAGLVFALSVSPLLGVAIFLVGLAAGVRPDRRPQRRPVGPDHHRLLGPPPRCPARQWRNDAMRLGHIDGEPTWPTLPAHLAGLRILDVAADVRRRRWAWSATAPPTPRCCRCARRPSPSATAPSRPAAWPAGAASWPASPARPAPIAGSSGWSAPPPPTTANSLRAAHAQLDLARRRIRWPRATWTW